MACGFLYSPRFAEHRTAAGHPERPERVAFVYEALLKSPLFKQLKLYEPTPCPLEWIERVHDPPYIERVRAECEGGTEYFDSADTSVCAKSYEIALLAAGSGIVLLDALAAHEIDSGFALVRPPGHHAERDIALGFCLFNNVAIAARYAQERHGMKKVLIVDWDVHHGNGTQHAFEDDPSVFYFSTHQFPFYPGTGSETERGRGAGVGTTLNVPLPAGSGDREIVSAFEKKLHPAAVAFKPDLILISAGFDAHVKDPLAGLAVSTAAYGRLTEILQDIAHTSGSRGILSFLEGGYSLPDLAASIECHITALAKG